MSLRQLGGSLLIIVSLVLAKATRAEGPEVFTQNGRTLTSPFFGFALEAPRSWTIAGPDERERFYAAMKRKVEQGGIEATDEEMRKKVGFIAMISQYPLHKGFGNNANLMITFLKVDNPTWPYDLCSHLANHAKHAHMAVEQPGRPVQIGRKSFCQLVAAVGRHSHETEYYTELNGYGLFFQGSYANEQGHQAITETVGSLEFTTK